MPAFDLFSVGHSNVAADRFIALLRSAGIDTIADVRSAPVSRFCPWFSAKNLAPLLAENAIAYWYFGDALGGRPNNPALYRDGVADYEAMARQPEFRTGLDRLRAVMAKDGSAARVCLMCAERDPLDCHRCLLVARELAAHGMAIGHILHDGSIEPHGRTEQRLLALDEKAKVAPDLFVTGQSERLAAAYRRRALKAAYRTRASDKKP